jgi:hypothetical protein
VTAARPTVTAMTDSRVKQSAGKLPDGTAYARRYEGLYKRPGFHYPKCVVCGDFLYVAYATNKEDVELTRIPLASLAAVPARH